jgi:PKD repeat protein
VYNATSGFSKSTDGGNTFVSPFTTSCNYIHSDIRGVSAVGNVVLIADDGGLGLSTDGAASVVGTGFEINSMDMWGFSSSPKSDICLTGLDHNQTFVRSFAGAGGWKAIKGADAGVCTVNPYDDHWLYYDWAYGVNKGYLNADGTVTESSVSTVPDLGSLQFHPNRLYDIYGIQKSNNNIVVHSTDNMETATTFKDFGVKVNSFRVSRQDPKTMYALLNNQNIQKTTDSGATWVTITPSSATSNGQTNITAIEAGKTPGELWAAYGNAQNTCKVLHSTDGGVSWTNMTTATLPAVAVSDIAYQRGTNGGVYIITITSNNTLVWYRNNTMADWQQVGSPLPLMGYLKSRLFVVPAMNKIRFGSSRGAWENDLYELSSPVASMAVDKTTPLCSGDSIQFINSSAYAPGTVSYNWQFPGGTPSASTLENPKVSYAAPGTYAATFTVTTTSGSDIVTVNNLITVSPSKCHVDTLAGNALAFSTTTPGNPALVSGYTQLSNSNSFTISAWIKPAATQTAWTGLICANNETNGSCILNFRNTNLELGCHWKGNLWPTSTNLFAVPNEWNHVALVVYPDSIRIYLNGNSFTYVQSTAAANWKDILLGGFNTRTDRNYAGLMDEVRIYNCSLSQDEIRALRHLTVKNVSTENGLVGYLQFDDALDYILDESKNAQVGSRAYNTSNYSTSTAPVASGFSEKATISTSGAYNYVAPQVSLSFAGGATVPNGDVWVTRLNTLPFNVDTTVAYPQSKYYVINNYGSNASFSAPNALTFKNVQLASPTFVNYYKLFAIKRGDNKDNLTDWSASLDSVQLSSNGTNTIDVPFTHMQITNFGQFVITRRQIIHSHLQEPCNRALFL